MRSLTGPNTPDQTKYNYTTNVITIQAIQPAWLPVGSTSVESERFVGLALRWVVHLGRKER